MIKRQSFITGAMLLGIASVLCKVLSAVFKIPLDTLYLHEEGIALYQSAYSVYNLFLAVFVTALPIALSGLIAQNPENAEGYCKTALVGGEAVCIAFAALLAALSSPIARAVSGGSGKNIRLGLVALLPAIAILGISGAIRGYFQGCKYMLPSAVGQIAESLVKVALGLGLCAAFVGNGTEYGAAGALLGASTGQAVCAAILFIWFKKTGGVLGKFDRGALREIVCLCIPVAFGSFYYTVALFCDTVTVLPLLAKIGVEPAVRLKSFGLLTRAGTIYNLPATVIAAVTAGAVPMLASHKGTSNVGIYISRAIRLIMLVAAPCGFGMMFFSKEIMRFIYKSAAGCELLALYGMLVLIMPYVQTTTAMLQALGKVWKPIGCGVGCLALKAVLNVLCVPRLGIIGAPVATAAAFCALLVFNCILLQKEARGKPLFADFAKILFAGAAACGAARVFQNAVPDAGLISAMIVAGILYAVLVAVLRAVKKEDIKAE